MSSRIRVLVVEDEPPARRRLRALLDEQPDMSVVAECGDGVAAVEFILSQRPDLVFLDVEIPELNGLAVVETVGPANMPPVVFVTAYDQYAVQAFTVSAVDYLLKPFDHERFLQAIGRAREQVRRPDALAERLSALLLERRGTDAGIERLPVRVGDRIRLVALQDVDYVTAAGSYVRLHAGRDTYLVRDSISSLEARLDSRFARLHRSLIVNTTRVRELEPLYRGEYVIWMQDGVRLVSGRTYRSRVQEVFGV
jgi:two-component system, LytTR family, response regulator